jgi:hypothetical protein
MQLLATSSTLLVSVFAEILSYKYPHSFSVAVVYKAPFFSFLIMYVSKPRIVIKLKIY